MFAAIIASVYDVAYFFGNDTSAFQVNHYGTTDCDALLRDALAGEISDTFKEINGFRPRFYAFYDMDILSLIKLHEEINAEAREYYKSDAEQEAEQDAINARYMDSNPATYNPFAGLADLLAA